MQNAHSDKKPSPSNEQGISANRDAEPLPIESPLSRIDFMSPSSVLALQRTYGNQFVMRLFNPLHGQPKSGGSAAGNIQRTLGKAKLFASKNEELNSYDVRNRKDIEQIMADGRLTIKVRQELAEKYNEGMQPDDQIPVPQGQDAAPTATIITPQNYFNFWSQGAFDTPQENADHHFHKHIEQQKEFSGLYQDVAAYTVGALQFSEEPGVLEDGQQGGNWGRYTYNIYTQKGKMVVLNGQNSKLASFYELNKSPEETAKYVAEKLGILSTWRVVLEKFKETST